MLWAMDALGRIPAGAQAGGLRHATAVADVGRHLGGGAMVVNHRLAAHPLAATALAARVCNQLPLARIPAIARSVPGRNAAMGRLRFPAGR